MQGLISNPSVWRDRFVLNSKYTNAVKTLSQKNQSTEFIVNSFAVKYLQSPRSTNAMSVAVRNCGFDLLVALARNRFLLSAPQTWRHVSASSSLAVIESLCLCVCELHLRNHLKHISSILRIVLVWLANLIPESKNIIELGDRWQFVNGGALA